MPSTLQVGALQLRWLDENRLQLAPGIRLNVHSFRVFGDTNIEWAGGGSRYCPGDAYGDTLDCGDGPPLSLSVRGDIAAWLVEAEPGAAGPLLCVYLPAVAACPDDEPGEAVCHALIDEPPSPPVQPEPLAPDPLFDSLLDMGRVFISHRGRSHDDAGGCFEWDVQAGNGLVLKRTESEGERLAEVRREIFKYEDTYSWTWSIWYRPRVLTPAPPPNEHEARASCPDPTQFVTAGSSLMCAPPLGRLVRETAGEIQLSKLVFYKTRLACEQAVNKNSVLAKTPSCHE